MGALLAERDKNPGGRPEQESYPSHRVRGRTPKLDELGISYKQSSRWQLEASVPEEVGRLQEEEKRAAKKRERAGKRVDPTRAGGEGTGEAVDKAGQAVGVTGGDGVGGGSQHHHQDGRRTTEERVLTSRDPCQAERGGNPGFSGAPRSIESLFALEIPLLTEEGGGTPPPYFFS